MSVLVFHTSVAPFVQQAAKAFHDLGILERFITSVRSNPKGGRQRFACKTSKLVGFDLASLLARRRVTQLPEDKVESIPYGELLRLLVGRLDKNGRVTDRVWAWSEPAFDRAVARRLQQGKHRAVYGFEYSSLATFNRARELGMRVFYDMPAPESRFVHSILEAEIAKFPELDTPYRRQTLRYENSRTARRLAEWNAAELVIAASQFTKASFAASGLDARKVQVVPYGAPPVASRDLALGAGNPKVLPLKLIWAGTFSVRKGAHYLLEAWRKGRLGQHARLSIFGTIALPDRLMKPLPDGIEVHGSIPREELMHHYGTSDALIFPTLCDGFGMVVTEAWSRGLPVITTERAGAADLLKAGQNGLLIRDGDREAISQVISWCLSNRTQLRSMREAALGTAEGWQWKDYRKKLTDTLCPNGAFG